MSGMWYLPIECFFDSLHTGAVLALVNFMHSAVKKSLLKTVHKIMLVSFEKVIPCGREIR